MVRGELSGLHRRIMAALITIDVHARDIVDHMWRNNVCDINDFNWQMQLRYYFENEDLIVRQVCMGWCSLQPAAASVCMV